MSLWVINQRGHGIFDREYIFPPGVIHRNRTVLINICEVGQPQGQPLDFPFMGNAGMQIHNIVPRDDGRLVVRIGVYWDHDLDFRLRFVVFD